MVAVSLKCASPKHEGFFVTFHSNSLSGFASPIYHAIMAILVCCSMAGAAIGRDRCASASLHENRP